MERFLLLLFQTITVAWAATPDPCLQGVYREINETRRSISYRVQSTEIPLCDINLQFGWYRFTSNAGGEMPTNCVPVNQCGTQMPVWLNGTHPSVTDGIVDRTLCVHFSSRRRARPCCDYVAGTKIKNCGQFYVYYLQPVPSCPMAYCAGTLEPCPPGQTGFKPNCQDIYPRLLNLPHLSGPTIEDGSFYFSCEFETAQQYGSQFFDVIWTVDGQLLPNSNMTIQDTSPKLNGSLLQGHLNKNVGCKVKSYFDNTPDTASEWIQSENTYWAGIRIEPERLEISEASEERPVTVTATLPKVCTRQVEPDDCMIKINLELSGSANDAAIPNDCVYRIFAANWTDDTKQAKLVINVKARRDHIANNQNRQVMLQFQPVVDNGVFRDAVIEAIPITIHDEAETKCSILGDPHIRGMEYKTSEFYNLYRVGDYTLYENTERLFEVQIRTYKCGSEHVELSCTCGVAIREYDDLIIMDNCNNLIIGRNTVFTTPVYPRGRLSDATTVEKSRDGQQVVVYLPSSTEVKISQGYWGLDVDLTIPSSDKGHGQGLCGTFDGNPNNEFTFRGEGRVDMTCERQDNINNLGCVPEGFSQSWRNNDSTSLFKTTPPPVYIHRPDVYCTCAMNKEVECSARGDISKKILRCSGSCIEEIRLGFIQTREIDASVNVYEDVPMLSSYDPDDFKDFVPTNASWPTPSGKTEQMAEEMCRSAIQSSQLWSLCNTTSKVNDSDYLESCKVDILITDSEKSVETYVSAYMTDCQVNVATDPESYVENENGETVLKPEIAAVDEVCSLECLKNGHCQQGICICNSSFTGSNCQLRKDVGPQLHQIYGLNSNSSLESCDANIRPCRHIFIQASNFEVTDNLACKIQEVLVNGSLSMTTLLETATFVTSDMLSCSLPDAQVKSERSVKTFAISVTNDGVLYGNEVRLTVFDSSCQSCNGSNCVQLPNTCQINNLCYQSGDLNPNDNNQICNTDLSTSLWSQVPTISHDYPNFIGPTLSGPTHEGTMVCAFNTSDTSPIARFKISWYIDGTPYPVPRELNISPGQLQAVYSLTDLPRTGMFVCKIRSLYSDRNILSPYQSSNAVDLSIAYSANPI